MSGEVNFVPRKTLESVGKSRMTVENKGSENVGKVWVRSSSLLPVILPCSPPSTFSIQSLAKLRELVEETGEGWDVDRTR